ncbi:MAG: YidC/Oxa1 family insertase periplasmic-domain containing protein [Planctomycetaceae bacterium]|nr:YidC/Oxa1 family insertase periplasmic-domain containing protein [Planctomycetaceae bacterium]
MGIWIAYATFVLPQFMPPRPQVAKVAPVDSEAVDGPVSALAPLNIIPEIAAPKDAQAPAVVEHPVKTVELGSTDPTTGYFIKVELNSRGAAVENVTLNDERYPEFGQRGTPLRLIGHNPLVEQKTFALQVPTLDSQLGGLPTDIIAWEVVDAETTPDAVTFRLITADGKIELRKRYEIEKAPADKKLDNQLRDTWVDGYRLKLSITAKNLGSAQTTFAYLLRGPAALPLEDAPNTYKYRDIRLGFLRPDNGIDASLFNTKTAVQEKKAEKPSTWLRPLSYIGVDTQYFAALVRPEGDQQKSPTVMASRAEVLKEGRYDGQADISVVLDSTPVALNAGDEVTHEYSLYSLPKRQALLTALKAEAVLDYGLFQPIVLLMLWIFDSLHSIGLSYGLAIIGLTIIIRTLLYPLTRHQIRTMEKMKEHQPELKILHEKMKKDPESLTTEERQKMQSIQLKMMGGCLPLLLQMPIFIALYRALQVSVDLRMAPMHVFGSWTSWIDNLASPDRLFQFGFAIPWLEWSEFNLLPLLSTALMIVNQKLTMPPPVDEEQRIQQKTMNFTMAIMGAMFYRVPSGLCVYIITSSAWGMIERALLKKFTPVTDTTKTPSADENSSGSGNSGFGGASGSGKPAGPPDKPGMFDGFKQKIRELQEMADKQGSVSRDTNRPNPPRDNRKGKGRK